MKKHTLIRNSFMAVAAVSLLLGGAVDVPKTAKTTSKDVKIVADKAIQKSASKVTTADKGKAVEETKNEQTSEQKDDQKLVAYQEPTTEAAPVEEKEAKVESNQVVANIDTFLNIRAEASEDSEVVGKFYNGNVGTLIEQGDEWSVVASGNAYGYVKNDYILSGAVAESYIENNCDQVAKVTTDTLNVRAEESTDSDIVALSGEGEALSVVGEDGDWVKVATKDGVEGYVSSDYICLDYAYDTAVTIEEENAAIAAEEAKQREEAEAAAAASEASNNNSGSNSGSGSTSSGSTSSSSSMISDSPAVSQAPTTSPSVSGTGQSIADFAVQFVGNPYVYGGTSLTNGADCSGFVMSVFANFGISLPRTSYSQASAGRAVSVSELQPGDLLFYHGFGHVAIYIGGGQVVHASNAQTGIKISAYNYSNIDRVVRVVD